MKKMRKGKKMLIILLVVFVAIIATILIVNVVKKHNQPEVPEYQNEIIQLPEIVYSNMNVRNIHVQYLKNNNETKLRMTIDNTSNKVVKDDVFDAVLIGPDENVLTTMEARIVGELNIGEQCDVEVILEGDQTAVTQIKLIEK